MKGNLRSGYDTGFSIVTVWMNANASAMGAAVAFYTIFAIAPLLILVLALAGIVFGHEDKLLGGNGNIVHAGSAYDSGGSFVVSGVKIANSYKIAFGPNEIALNNGTQTLNASGTILALGSNLTLHGTANSSVTASVAGQRAENQLFGEISKLVGPSGSQSIRSILVAANRPKASLLATITGFVALFIGASSVFIQLQQALNAIWGVRVKSIGIRSFIRYRVLSFMTLLGIGFLLLVSLVVSAALNAVGKWMTHIVPLNFSIWKIVDFGASLAVVTLLFAMIFKLLPDVKIAWRDTWVGAVITALLFTVGKFLLGAYLGRSSLSSAYGAAGSFVVVLLWVYYSAQILMFGAAFVRVYSDKYGSHSRPTEDAEFVTTTVRKLPPDDHGSQLAA